MAENMYRGVPSVFIVPVFLLLTFSPAFAEGRQALPLNKINELVSRKVLTVDGKAFPFKKGIVAGRYMEDDVKGGCREATLPGWEAFPLKQCTYNQPDKNAPRKLKTATVIRHYP